MSASLFFESLPPEILNRATSLDLNISSSKAHEAIDEILSKTVLSGGKRLRPLLTFLSGNLFKTNFDLLSPYARATELVHAASLAHDDVIDNATLRRGRPSINILSSNKLSVLAGDYLLSKVIVDLTYANNLELLKRMSLVIKDLSEGEWLQLDLIHSRLYTKEKIIEIAMKKTSSVMSYCTSAPAVLSGMSEKIINEAHLFGVNLGIAFQLIDDTLDFSSTSKKDAKLDIDNNLVSAVTFDYLDKNPELFLRYKNGEDLSNLIDATKLGPSIESVVSLAHEYLDHANKNLDRIAIELNEKFGAAHTEEAITYLKLILSFLVLRKI